MVEKKNCFPAKPMHCTWVGMVVETSFLQRLIMQTTFDFPPLRCHSLFTLTKFSQWNIPLILVCSQQTLQAVIILGNQLKKMPGMSHQLQNHTSREIQYYSRFSVSHDSKEQ